MAYEKHTSGALSGIRIVVTRAEEDQKGFVTRLQQLGARVFSIPSIEKKELLPEPDCLTLLKQFRAYDWVIFTSPFAVQVLETPAFPLAKACKNTKIAAVGPSTAKTLEKQGVRVHCLPDPHTWQHLSTCMGDLNGSSICLPRSRKGAIEFPEMLRSRGARIVEIWTYNTVPNIPEYKTWIPLEQKTDYILFTSGTTVKGFHRGLKTHGLLNTVTHTQLACIGPSTAATCRKVFGRADLVAQPHTEGGLIAALINQINLENQHE